MTNDDTATIDDVAIARAKQILRESRHIVVLTGAGISTDSGIPDFRGPQGLWTKDPAAEKMATIQHYIADPEVRRRAWRLRVQQLAAKRAPNAGHHALVSLERTGRLDVVLTQNVDGLHHDAGHDSERVVEVHGTIREVACLDCGDRTPMDSALERVRAGEDDPPCLRCGGILKSATISFGQSLVAADLERADRAARACDCLLAVGSTLAVYPIAAVVPTAREAGARVIIVNGSPTEMDDEADVVLRGSISAILPRIVAA